jgi:hypothetical protein
MDTRKEEEQSENDRNKNRNVEVSLIERQLWDITGREIQIR